MADSPRILGHVESDHAAGKVEILKETALQFPPPGFYTRTLPILAQKAHSLITATQLDQAKTI